MGFSLSVAWINGSYFARGHVPRAARANVGDALDVVRRTTQRFVSILKA